MKLLSKILSLALIFLVFAKDIGAFCLSSAHLPEPLPISCLSQKMAHPVDLSSDFETGLTESLDLTPASQSLDAVTREAAKKMTFQELFTVENCRDHLLRAGISSGVNAAVQGRGLDVGQTVGSGLASFLGESFARKIGEMRGAHIAADAQERLGFQTDSGVVDGVNFVEHKLLHGLLGATTGALLDVNDPGRSALSGAFGGVVAETVAEALTLFKTEDTLVHYEDFCHQNDLEPTREGCIQYVNAEMAQFVTQMSENANRNADIADVSTALGAMMFNLDVNIAHEVARNAADNNFLFLPFAIMAASALWSAYEIKQAYDEGGVPAALQQLGVELVINVVGGAATNAVFKIGGKAVKNGAELVTALCDHCPAAAGFIRSIGDQIVRHADRLLASNAGQLAAAGADGLLRMDAAAYRGVERIAQNVAQTGGKVADKVAGKPLNGVLRKELKPYIVDMERRSGIAIQKQQRDHLANALRENKYTKLDGAAKKAHGREYRRAKDNMIREWEANTGNRWPRFENPSSQFCIIMIDFWTGLSKGVNYDLSKRFNGFSMGVDRASF